MRPRRVRGGRGSGLRRSQPLVFTDGKDVRREMPEKAPNSTAAGSASPSRASTTTVSWSVTPSGGRLPSACRCAITSCSAASAPGRSPVLGPDDASPLQGLVQPPADPPTVVAAARRRRRASSAAARLRSWPRRGGATCSRIGKLAVLTRLPRAKPRANHRRSQPTASHGQPASPGFGLNQRRANGSGFSGLSVRGIQPLVVKGPGGAKG
jgi:hypothetical protein